MRVALIWLLLLTVATTNLVVAADAHFADPATSAALTATPDGDDSSALPCQICLHGPALTLLPQLPSLPSRSDRPSSPAHAAQRQHPAALPDRIDEPPRSSVIG